MTAENDALQQRRAWMAEIDLPVPAGPDFMSLIPSQRMAVGMLMSAGTILTYSVSADRSKLWTVIAASSEADVRANLAKFPILPWTHVTVRELFFHEFAQIGIPRMSVN